MADNQRTLTLAIKADIEVARTQLENLVGIMGKSAADVDNRLGRIEGAFDRTSNHISVRGQALATTIGTTIGTTLGSLLGRIPGELITLGRAAVENAASIKNTAESLGIATDALQDFRLGAAKVGVDVKQADSALETFQKTSGKAASGNKAAAASFAAIGVDIADSSGRLKPFEQLLGDVADGLARVPDPARQATAAQKLFGESGAELLPFLREGSKGINDLAKANELLGLKLSTETIEKLDQLGNKAEAVQQVFTAQMATAIADNADAIIGLGNAAAGAVGYLGEVLAYAKGLAAIRANEGFLAQFTSDFDRTTALGKKGGAVQVYGQEYMDAKKARQAAEASFLPDFLNGAAAARLREDQARVLYRNAVDAQEAERARAAAPGAPPVPGGIVVPPPGPKPKAAPKVKKPYDLQGNVDALLASPAQMSKAFVGQAQEVAGTIARLDGSAETLSQTLDRAFSTDGLDSLVERLPDLTREIDLAHDAGQQLIGDLAFGLASIATQSGNAGDKIVSTFARIGEAWIQSGIMNFLSGGTQGTSFGTIFKGVTSLFGGARAEGGPTQAGMTYLVGEKGPELWTSPGNGTVIPTHALRAASAGGGGRGATYNSWDLRGALVTEDVLARIDAMGNQAAVRGAVGGQRLAAEDSARRGRRRLGLGR